MHEVVLYGVGSSIVVDVETSLERAGLRIAAAVQNTPGTVHVLDQGRLIDASDLPPGLVSLPFLVPLFTPGYRQRAAREALAKGFKQPLTLIDATVSLPRSTRTLPGLYVNSGCSLGAASRLGAFVFINRGASVGHHVDLGDFASIGPGAVLAGMVRVGRGAVIGAGAVVLPELTIGDNAVVAAGSVVTTNVADRCIVRGNPARVVRDNIEGYADVAVVD